MNRRRSLTLKLLPLGVAAAVLAIVFGGGSLVTGASGAGGNARDDDGQGCTLASLKGAYAYHVAGSGPGASGEADIAGVGLAVSDGKGHLSGHDWASFGGATTPRTFTGTYTVEPDCTGTVHSVYSVGGAANAFFVLAAGGRILKVIQTDQGTVISGDAVRQ